MKDRRAMTGEFSGLSLSLNMRGDLTKLDDPNVCGIVWLATLLRLEELPGFDDGMNSCAVTSCIERFDIEFAMGSLGTRVACDGAIKTLTTGSL